MTARCRWDREQEAYLRDGEPCQRDDYGDPTRHCTARRSCGNHIGADELTCARCVGRARADIRRIVAIAPLMRVQALGVQVGSEAAYLAGPAADHGVFEARRAISRAWIYANISQPARDWCDEPKCQRRHFKTAEGDRWHKRGIENAIADLLPDDDEHHPYSVLTRWEFMLREDYDQRRPMIGCRVTNVFHLEGAMHEDDPDRCARFHGPDCWSDAETPTSTTSAGAYLDRTLHRMAQDDEQDFPLFAREMRQCRDHLEAVLRNSSKPERGAPCPDCREDGRVVRLQREYGHWCEDPECERQWHHTDDAGDRWVCPADRDHWMTQEGYAEWLKHRTGKRHDVGA